MLLSEMRTAVADMAGDQDNTQFSTAQIDRYINWAQTEIAVRYDIYEKVATITTLDSTDLIGAALLPADFVRVANVFWNGTKLAAMQPGNLYNAGDVVGTGVITPDYYVIENYRTGNQRRMSFYPYVTPGLTTGFTIKLFYVARPADLTLVGDISPLPLDIHETICEYAVTRCKMQENDLAGAKFFMDLVREHLAYLGFNMSVANADSYAEVRADAESLFTQYD
jgi:hypothetical protein